MMYEKRYHSNMERMWYSSRTGELFTYLENDTLHSIQSPIEMFENSRTAFSTFFMNNI